MFSLKFKAQAVTFPWPFAVSERQSSWANKSSDGHFETRQTGKQGLREVSEMQSQNTPRD